MTHTPLPVHGYTGQPQANVTSVNENKQIEERLLRRLDKFARVPEIDQRWLAVARRHFEQGFMELNRAIFKPTRIDLPEDLPKDGETPPPDAP